MRQTELDRTVGICPLPTMKYVDEFEALRMMCYKTQKWGLYLSFVNDFDYWEKEHGVNMFEELEKAVLFYSPKDNLSLGQFAMNGRGFFFFDTEEEMNKAFDMCVGDDGPTQLNRYSGPFSVYAMTCSNKGVLLNENS